jgi:tetratricopeptide (TPR) repeat protein/tRNA A-37 threonylcarbamoyl transferase component Bud32
MNADRWRQIEALFIQAIECSPVDRPNFLNRVCNGDDDLRRELESLLECDAPDQRLVEVPTTYTPTLPANGDLGSDLTGRRIGPYRLMRLIGYGGMGSVYLGVRADDQYEKQVAIKLLKRGMDTDFMLSRFRQERQILANLEHPFIARLLDGGATEDGLPYFVMEYVDGVAITRYCDEKRLSVSERLRLFRLVCEAVQHAHQNLVVHRDIKPSNILTTKEGIPKLLDFGIAKMIGPGSGTGVTLTQVEQRMLTPDYASPEQVKGLPISTASDIYSLGAVLYELLSGQRPHRFPSGSLVDMERIICEVDPEKPSLAASRTGEGSFGVARQLRRQLSGDLDNIILMALRKEPQRRYASSAELSEDLRRHMEARPIVAHDDRWIYRAGKFIRRNRMGVGAVALLIASLISGIVATTFQARRAERRFEIVRGLANSMLFDLHDQMERLPGSTQVRASMIATVLRYLDNLAKDAGQDSGLKLEIAKAYHRIAAIEGHPLHTNLGRTASARSHYQRAMEILTGLASQSETRVAATEEMVRVNIETGDIELAAGNFSGAKAAFTRAAALADSVEVSPGSRVFAYLRLGDIEAQQGAAGAAVPHYRKALESAEAWDATSTQPEAHRLLRGTYSRLANASRESGDLFSCRENLRKAMQVSENGMRQRGPSHEDRRSLLSLHASMADVQGGPDDLNLGESDAALANYRIAFGMAEEFVSADQHDVRARRDLAIMSRFLARMLIQSDAVGAGKLFAKALEIAAELRASDPANIDFRRDVMEAHLGLGIVARRTGSKEEAMERLTRALELQKTIEAAVPDRIWVTRYITQIYTEIGHALMKSGDMNGALANYQHALAAAERLLGRAPTSLYLARDRANVFEAMGSYFSRISARAGLPASRRLEVESEARSWLKKSLALWQDWNRRKLAAPYAARREKEVIVALAAIGHRE